MLHCAQRLFEPTAGLVIRILAELRRTRKAFLASEDHFSGGDAAGSSGRRLEMNPCSTGSKSMH
jgi:hypothetical protein